MSYTKLVSSVLFPFHEAMKRHGSVRLRKGLEASQWWPREKIEAERLERLRDFLVEAGERVPFYRAVFSEAGFDPRALESISELSAVPFLTKQLIRANLKQLL